MQFCTVLKLRFAKVGGSMLLDPERDSLSQDQLISLQTARKTHLVQ